MKKLRITLDGREYIVDVEILQDDDQGSNTMPSVVRQPRNDNRQQNQNQSRPQQQSRPQNQPKPQQNNSKSGGVLKSPMNGVVLEINVKPGDTVKQSQTLVAIEAMKMKTNVNAQFSAVVKSIEVKIGDTVEQNATLITFE